ncbi:MAG: 2-amino-4-hydroxy-6-hydroxymethyldihydropteridine diphosphokinase [Proteobacteria bacterium]|nr:2-amino-4-hydroxy-6-hydroxymethyldihydropteridine diphosphokinase [Pseudomonadota bacterium]
MPPSHSGYLLGIGSNLEPQQNIVQIIQHLLDAFPTIVISRVLELPPIGMNSHHDFLNIVVFIETDNSEVQLKTICNTIEVQLGRDRSDPDRKTKDRPADLDILATLQLPNDAQRAAYSITDEYFLYPLIDEIVAYLLQKPIELPQKGVTLSLDGLSFGQTATTINR